MDSSTQRDNNPETIRERVESKQDEFAGGSEPGWQTLEATVDDTRHKAAEEWTREGGDTTAGGTSQTGTVTDVRSSARTEPTSEANAVGDIVSEQKAAQIRGTENDTPPFNDEHPLGTGQQCFICGAYNDVEEKNCWNCSTELTHSMVETPGIVDSVHPPETDDTLKSISTGGMTEGDRTEGARPVSSD